MDADYRVALLALRTVVEHERSLKGTVLHDPVVWTIAYQALNKCGYLDKPIPAPETSVTPASAPAEPSTSECITGYWFCANCHLCNSETIHHTSCPTCGGLRPTANRGESL
jgi:hypothetical protein